MYFRVLGGISDIKTIAIGAAIREIERLRRRYGRARWRKRKGYGTVRLAELHWYEATGVGRRELKLKGYLD